MQRFWQRAFVLAAAVCMAATSLPAQPRIHVAIGHNGAVAALESHPEDPLLFSGAEDGVVLVWDTLTGSLIKRLHLAHDPITRIAHHPSRNELLLHVRHSAVEGTIIAYDWETETVLFEREVVATPTYLGYSPGGTLAVVALPDFDSMLFFSAQTGNVRPYLTDGFGAVSFVIVARSERNVLTYIPSRGEIIYWELRTGRELQVVDTAERLENVTFVDPETQRFLAASDSENLVIFDNVTGEVTSSYELTPIVDISFDAESGDIFVLSERFNRPTVLVFRQQAGRLRRQSFSSRQIDPDTTVIASATGNPELAFIGGSAIGSLSTYSEGSGRRDVLAPPAPSPVRALAFARDQLYVTQSDRLITFESDLFTGLGATRDSDSRSSSQSVRISTFDATTRRIGDLTSFSIGPSEDGLLMWGDERPGEVWIVSDDREMTETIYADPQNAEIITAKESDGALLVVHRGGRVVLFPNGNDESGVSFESSGLRDAVWDRDLGLIVARSRTELLDSSLLVVDLATGETAAIDADTFLTDKLVIDHEANVLFALSLTGEPSEPSTVVRRYSGEMLRTQRVLWRQPGEHLSGALRWDREGNTLYAALDGYPLAALAGARGSSIETGRRDAQAIAANASVVATANADGSVSIFWKDKNTHLADVYLIDGGWIFATERNYLVSDRRLIRYLSVTGMEADDALERQELQLPLMLRPDY